MPTAFRLLPAPTCCVLLALLIAPSVARAETIYAVTMHDGSAISLLRFDSDSPSALENVIPIQGALEEYYGGTTLEFDLVTRELYGFAYEGCAILCPPLPVVPMRIDPLTGHSALLDWPEFPGLDAKQTDNDIDPLTRELRFVGQGERNLRFGLDDLSVVEDEPFDLEGEIVALAHAPPGAGDAAGETFAIVRNRQFASWLARIGGPRGIPPASSGEVTLIGELAIQGVVQGFDISEFGTAFFVAFELVGEGLGRKQLNRLYRVDLTSASAEELGIIPVPNEYPVITGIAVAPEGPGPGVLEIPSLSPVGLALLALVLAGVALVCLSARRRIGTTR